MRPLAGLILLALVLSGCATLPPPESASRAWQAGEGASLVYEVTGHPRPYAMALSMGVPERAFAVGSTITYRWLSPATKLTTDLQLVDAWRVAVEWTGGPESSGVALSVNGERGVVQIEQKAPKPAPAGWVSMVLPEAGAWCFLGSVVAAEARAPGTHEVEVPLGSKNITLSVSVAVDGTYTAKEAGEARLPFRLEGSAALPCPTRAEGRSNPHDENDTRPFTAVLKQARDGSAADLANARGPAVGALVSAPPGPYGLPPEGRWRDSAAFPLREAAMTAAADEKLAPFLRAHPAALLIHAKSHVAETVTTRFDAWHLEFGDARASRAVMVTRMTDLGLDAARQTTVSETNPMTKPPVAGFPADGLVDAMAELTGMAAVHERVMLIPGHPSVDHAITRDGSTFVVFATRIEPCESPCFTATTQWDGGRGHLVGFTGPREAFVY